MKPGQSLLQSNIALYDKRHRSLSAVNLSLLETEIVKKRFSC